MARQSPVQKPTLRERARDAIENVLSASDDGATANAAMNNINWDLLREVWRDLGGEDEVDERPSIAAQLAEIANHLATVRDEFDDGEPTAAGISGNIDELNKLIARLEGTNG